MVPQVRPQCTRMHGQALDTVRAFEVLAVVVVVLVLDRITTPAAQPVGSVPGAVGRRGAARSAAADHADTIKSLAPARAFDVLAVVVLVVLCQLSWPF